MPSARPRGGRALRHTASEALRRAVPLLLAAYFFASIAATLLPLEAIRRLQLSFPEPPQPKLAGTAAPGVELAAGLPPIALLAPAGAAARKAWLFPEAGPPWFSLRPAASVECTGPLGPPAQFVGLQAALQACLGSPWCACASWDAGQLGSARLYSGHRPRLAAGPADSPDAVIAVRLGCRHAGEQQQLPGSLEVPQPPCAAAHAAALAASAAFKAAGNSIIHNLSAATAAELCPPGMHPVAPTVGGMACSPCKGGYCGQLPGAQLLPASSLDAPLQAAIAASQLSADSRLQMRGFNPSVLLWRGRHALFARASNISSCSSPGGEQGGVEHAAEHAAAAGLAVASRILVCEYEDGAAPWDRASPRHCRELAVDAAALAAQVPGAEAIPNLQGVEDPRAFVHGGQPYLLVNFHVMQPDKRAWARLRQWWEAEDLLQSHMAVLRLSPALDAVERAAMLRCPGLHSTRQKNWMPLPLALPAGGALFFVTEIQPLTVVNADLASGSCRLVHGPGSEAGLRSGGGSSGGESSGRDLRGDGTDSSQNGSTAEGSAASLAAVLGGARLHGGSPFVPFGPSRYLSIVHHKVVLPYGRVYTHHWVVLEGGLGGTEGPLRVAWVSEGFRLPDMSGVRPNRDVQFASSLTLQGDELLIGYGAGDCHAVLSRVPHFRSQLASWLQHGLGTQAGSPPLAAQAGSAAEGLEGVAWTMRASWVSIRWEASLFGREERWAQAAAAIGARWQQSALPAAGARLRLRHLDQRPGPHNARQLGGLPFVTSNEQNGGTADVAISHARLAELVPAVGRAWVPWVPCLGTAAPGVTVELLRRHAARVLVPSTFHQTSLVQLLGFAAQQVAVLPQSVQGDDLCPAGFDALPGRQALQELGGPPASAASVVLLHQAPPGWQYGAALLLEAYVRAFSAADNVTLVIHQLSFDDVFEDRDSNDWKSSEGAREPHGSAAGGSGSWPVGSLAWAAAAGDPAVLAERAAALERNASSPQVLLLARTPRFGRWADKLLRAADVAVLPYLGGTAGRELVRAASCGRPVVTTAGGPAADAIGQAVWPVPAELQRCPPAGAALGGGPPSVPLGCLQVSPDDLGRALRAAWQSAEERQRRGAAARQAAAALVERSGWDALAGGLWNHVQEHLAQPQAELL